MKIIDNKRDYYDFVVGKYGMDEGVVFDRRGSYILAKTESDVLRKFFSTARRDEDKPRRKEDGRRSRYWFSWRPDDRYDFLVMEVGFVRYQFQVERYLDDDGKVHIDVIDCIRVPDCQKIARLPIAFISASQMYVRDEKTGKITEDYHSWRDPREELLRIKGCPIFEGTIIPSWISPEQIWLDLYEYLSSLKDIKITDNRTDIQKLESAGFDKRTSFRNV